MVFHVEVLYALADSLAYQCGPGRSTDWAFLVAAVACVAVKEERTFLPLFGVSIALSLIRFKSMTRQDRVMYADRSAARGAPQPECVARLSPAPPAARRCMPFCANYWASYGATPGQALVGMLAAPWRVLTRTLASGFFRRVLGTHLFLPLVGWRWTLGIVPIVLLYGASDNEQAAVSTASTPRSSSCRFW